MANVRSPRIGIDALVRSGGSRGLQRSAGRVRASSVACRGLTPDLATAIQAVTGSGVEDVQVEGNRSITEELSVDKVRDSYAGDGHHPGLRVGSPKVGMWRKRPARAGGEVTMLRWLRTL